MMLGVGDMPPFGSSEFDVFRKAVQEDRGKSSRYE